MSDIEISIQGDNPGIAAGGDVKDVNFIQAGDMKIL